MNLFNKTNLKLFIIIICSIIFSSPTKADKTQPVPSFVQNFIGKTPLTRCKTFTTSFERREEFSRFYIVPQNYHQAASHDLSNEKYVSGKSSHKAWIYRAYQGPKGSNNNHRAYPTIQLSKTKLGVIKTAALIELHALADIPLSAELDQDWFSIATFTSYDDIHWYRSYLVNVDKNYRLHLMHVPNQGQKKADIFSNNKTALTRGKWAKITIYIDYSDDNRFASPFIALWQDGTLISASRFKDRVQPQLIPKNQRPQCLASWQGKSIKKAEKLCKLKYKNGLAQMHFGLYAPPKLSRGVIYNDDLSVSRISKSSQCNAAEK